MFDRSSEPRIGIAQPLHLGDVIVCLPMAGILKQALPRATIVFIAPVYAHPVLRACAQVDEIADSDAIVADPEELARLNLDVLFNPYSVKAMARAAHQAGVPVRVGNLRRLYLLPLCNRFVSYSRRGSRRHEAQIVLTNLRALALPAEQPIEQLRQAFRLVPEAGLVPPHRDLLGPERFNLICHPKSHGNGREWPVEHYLRLIASLPPGEFRVFITGSGREGERLRQECPELFRQPQVVDLAGRFDLAQFIAFIAAADGLVAAGTGPLHIAAGLGKPTLGLYPPRRGIDPSRWQPLGPGAEYLVRPGRCSPGADTCPKNNGGAPCRCMHWITPESVASRIRAWRAARIAGDAQNAT